MKKITTLLFICLIATTAHAQLSSGLVAWWPFSGDTKDGSGKSHHGNAYNITYTAGKHGGANTAAVFNGTNSYIGVPYNSDMNLVRNSICAVVKIKGYYTGLCQDNRILSRGEDYNNGAYFLQFFDNAYDSSCTVTGDTSAFTFNTLVSNNTNHCKHMQYTPVIATNNWYCVVATWDDTTYRIYVNGILKYTAVPKIKIPAGTSLDSITIGNNRYGDYNLYPYWLNGVLDDVRLYNRALPASDIDNYCANYHNIHPESVETVPSLQFITAYPNPGNGSFTISGYTGNSKHVLVEISNTLGQVIYREDVTPVNNELNKTIALSAANGVYYINLRTTDDHKSMKVFIER